MRTITTTVTGVLFLTLLAGPARAQESAAPGAPLPTASARVRAVPALLPASHDDRSVLRILAHGAGGAVLGSWVGYMTSQIVWSDWHNRGPGEVNRLRYTLTGAFLGTVVGSLVGRHVASTGAVATPLDGARPAITTAEIQASTAPNAEELIRILRPRWLNPRGVDSIIGDAAGTDVVRVYRNGQPLGGPDELASIDTPLLVRVEYYDMKAATLRWGAGHSHGAIDVMTGSDER